MGARTYFGECIFFFGHPTCIVARCPAQPRVQGCILESVYLRCLAQPRVQGFIFWRVCIYIALQLPSRLDVGARAVKTIFCARFATYIARVRKKKGKCAPERFSQYHEVGISLYLYNVKKSYMHSQNQPKGQMYVQTCLVWFGFFLRRVALQR